MLNTISGLLIPCVLFIIIVYGLVKEVAVFDVFMEGAKEGLVILFRILPAIIAIMIGVSMLKASGALDVLIHAVKPVTDFLHIPSEIMPLALLRPVSGSGSLSVLSTILKDYGPDGFVGRCASVIMGSTETTFYTIAIYFGAARIKKTGYTVPVALFADFVSLLCGVFFVRLFLGQ